MALKSLKRAPGLKRYTDLAAAIHVLQTRSLTLLDPEKWDDGNDRAALAEYKKRKELKTLLALCFADCNETYHHWKVFASGVLGCALSSKGMSYYPHSTAFPMSNIDRWITGLSISSDASHGM